MTIVPVQMTCPHCGAAFNTELESDTDRATVQCPACSEDFIWQDEDDT